MAAWFTTRIDFVGQQLVETLTQYLLSSFAAVGLVVGVYQNSISVALMIATAGLAVTTVVCVPPWPFYRNNPVNWLPKTEHKEEELEEDEEEEEDGGNGAAKKSWWRKLLT